MAEVRCIRLTALFLTAMVATAHAQTRPDAGPPPTSATGNAPYGAITGDPSSPPPAAPPTTDPYPTPPAAFAPGVAPPMRSVVPPLDPLVHHRFRDGRIVYNVGTTVSFIGSSLTLASIIVTGIYGLGLDQSADQITGRIGPGLAYAGSSGTGAGFILVSTGLGLQHSALALAGQDPGRGMYAAGNVLGILGLCAIGTTYFFSATHYGGDSSPIYTFSAAVTAGALGTISSVLFFSDAINLRRVYRRLTTF